MCGIAGFLGAGGSRDAEGERALLERMGNALSHRGPDSRGEWFDGERRVGLSHRRLAILDPSPAGGQPMHSPHGRFVLVLNGEIYNHLELRANLAAEGSAPAWRGRSDTETLAAGFEAWGISGTLQRTVGMFALAAWDRIDATLTLGRDRMGEKPLYYGWQGHGAAAAFLFGSELKALRLHPSFQARLDRDVLTLFFRHNCIPSPHAIFQGMAMLAPGHLLEVSLEQPELRPRSWWSLRDAIQAGCRDPFPGDGREAAECLEVLLREAVRSQMVADVPVGAFLSGGVDSSTVVALMQAQSRRPVQTFTVGFREQGFDEAARAQAFARQLGTEHTSIYLSPADVLAVLPSLPVVYDEPFSDSSQIPTLLLSRLARTEVTVALTGDAGDELFGGYDRYIFAHRFWPWLSPAPRWMRRGLGRALQWPSPGDWDSLFDGLGRLLPTVKLPPHAGYKIHRTAGILGSRDLADIYFRLVSHWKAPAALVLNSREPNSTLAALDLPELDGVSRMMGLDCLSYLPDDLLVKIDRAAMDASLETRIPMLDHRVVEFSWRLPLAVKMKDGMSKWPLRQILHRHAPGARPERFKAGFDLPLGQWLRGPLRAWAEELLAPERLGQEGFLDPGPVREKWKELMQAKRNWEYDLWDVLMFQAWVEANPSVT